MIALNGFVWLFVAFLAATASLGATNAEVTGGWQSLFNGYSLAGWTQLNGTAEYQVEDRSIVGRTDPDSPNSFLCTTAEFADFELTFEVMFDAPLNTGAQIRSGLRSEALGKFQVGRVYGPQVEIAASPGRSGWIFGEGTGRGWISPEPLSDDEAINRHNYVRNGEWNVFRVLARGPRLQTWINGYPVADLRDEALYESHPRGFIALQVHELKPGTGPFEVRWRNLRLRVLDGTGPDTVEDGRDGSIPCAMPATGRARFIGNRSDRPPP